MLKSITSIVKTGLHWNQNANNVRRSYFVGSPSKGVYGFFTECLSFAYEENEGTNKGCKLINTGYLSLHIMVCFVLSRMGL